MVNSSAPETGSSWFPFSYDLSMSFSRVFSIQFHDPLLLFPSSFRLFLNRILKFLYKAAFDELSNNS